eukprot:8012355-Pyramimonas_sp.AAC.1
MATSSGAAGSASFSPAELDALGDGEGDKPIGPADWSKFNKEVKKGTVKVMKAMKAMKAMKTAKPMKETKPMKSAKQKVAKGTSVGDAPEARPKIFKHSFPNDG